MSNFDLGLLSFPILMLLIFLRMPIGLAMFTVGFGGMYYVTGGTVVALARLKSETFSTFSSYSLSIVPMFLLMGQFATLGGMSQALFKAAENWLGHLRGGVAMAAIGACAGFGAICGSSLATAATMGQVALPEMKRYGYSGGFSSATLAAGGTQTAASQYMTFLRRDDAEARLSADGYAKLLGLFAENMDMSWMTPERRDVYVGEWSRPGRLRGMVNWYRATPLVIPKPGETVAVPPMDPEKLRVRMPHLLVWGLGDTALLPEATEGLETYCDDLTRVEIEGADHWLVHQRPDEVAQILRNWLENGA